ncbi:hypothetical protein DH2020_011048 [Rehmannia glutinosa]|uniref:NPH3 domain-containing protein n=1 Tax=Rehmannia glutinosa TaxID=99300 RepID=A0ABR0XCH0_REHGL
MRGRVFRNDRGFRRRQSDFQNRSISKLRRSILVARLHSRVKKLRDVIPLGRKISKSCGDVANPSRGKLANPKGIRWQYTGKPHRSVSSPKWNEMKDSSPSRNTPVPPDWWFEDVSILRIDHFVRVITAIKVKGMRYELIGAAIMHYASKWLPGLIREGLGSGVDDGNNSSNSNGSSSSWKGDYT